MNCERLWVGRVRDDRFIQHFIHRDGVGLPDGEFDGQDPDLQATMTEEQFDFIPGLDLAGRFRDFPVETHAVLVRQFLRNRTAFQDSGYFEIFVNSHGSFLSG